jgi:hypothetical protein
VKQVAKPAAEVFMFTRLALLGSLALLAACDQNRDAGRETGAADERSGVDTAISSTRVADTAVVEKDTTIDVDTLKKTDNVKDKDTNP